MQTVKYTIGYCVRCSQDKLYANNVCLSCAKRCSEEEQARLMAVIRETSPEVWHGEDGG